jgi:hypothetical protein
MDFNFFQSPISHLFYATLECAKRKFFKSFLMKTNFFYSLIANPIFVIHNAHLLMLFFI